MDLHLTKDNISIVYHDHKLSRFTDCRGYVKEFAFTEIEHCAFQNNNEKIPRFEDVLLWSLGRIVVNAEFKELAVIDPSLALVTKYNAYEWVYFQVKNREQYTRVRSLDKKVNILITVNNRTDLERVIALHDEHILLIELAGDAATAENAAYIRANGKLSSKDSFDLDPLKEIFKAACMRVFTRNIDIAISNRPDSCVQQKEEFLRRILRKRAS
jgi:glycerophosphoryl diester phosphodiesterase